MFPPTTLHIVTTQKNTMRRVASIKTQKSKCFMLYIYHYMQNNEDVSCTMCYFLHVLFCNYYPLLKCCMKKMHLTQNVWVLIHNFHDCVCKMFQSTLLVLKYQSKCSHQEVIQVVQLNKHSICIIGLVKMFVPFRIFKHGWTVEQTRHDVANRH